MLFRRFRTAFVPWLAAACMAVPMLLAGCGDNGGPNGVDAWNGDVHGDDPGSCCDVYDIYPDLNQFDTWGAEGILCNPDPIDFETVEVGQSKAVTVTLRNEQTFAVDLTAIQLDAAGSTAFTVDEIRFMGGADFPGAFDAGAAVIMTMTYSPTAIGLDESKLIVHTEVDGVDVPWSFAVRGQTMGPRIELVPTEIDFGLGGQNSTYTATVKISNIGSSDLVITRLAITNQAPTRDVEQFAIKYDSAFPVTNPVNPVPSTVAQDSSAVVELTYTPKVYNLDYDTATLEIESNAVGQELVSVPLVGKGEWHPYCDAKLVPTAVDFGTVAAGTTASMSFELQNSGPGTCRVNMWKVADCAVDEAGAARCPASTYGTASANYTITQAPPDIIQGGQNVPITIEFSAPVFGGTFPALLSLNIQENDLTRLWIIPACDTDCVPNITGVSEIAE